MNTVYAVRKLNKIINKFMNFLKRLFKSEIKTLDSTTVKLVPLNQAVKDEKIRNMLIDYLTKKHGELEVQKIINSSKFGMIEFIPGSPMISIHTQDDKCFGVFHVAGNGIEENERIDPNSKEGKILYNHE